MRSYIAPVAQAKPSIETMLDQFTCWMHETVADGRAAAETIRAYMRDAREHLHWLHDQQLTPSLADEVTLRRYRAGYWRNMPPASRQPSQSPTGPTLR